MQDYDEWEEVSENKARIRNLLFAITKGILQRNIEVDGPFSIDNISKWFYFKKRDLAYHINCFFHIQQDTYYLNAETRKKVEGIIRNHNQVLGQLESAKVIFLKTFGRYEKEYKEKSGFHLDLEKQEIIYKEIKAIMPILHWGMLPIISKYLMINSGKIPEDDIIDFYDHFHMLQAMLREIRGEGERVTVASDRNLDIEMSFSVYARRHGYNSNYRIKRTIDGWDVSHIMINGKCDKNGEGALLKNLHHDSIFFPEEAVKYALSNLWEEAEDDELEIEELQKKIQQIAEWISSVETVVGEKQPEWVNYY